MAVGNADVKKDASDITFSDIFPSKLNMTYLSHSSSIVAH